MNIKAIGFFILFFFNLLWVDTVFAEQPVIGNMIFFGDSLSDVGDNTWISIDGEIGTPITNLNDRNYKYLWPDYLVKYKLNRNKSVYPFNQPNVSPFNDSISYAYASAETGDDYLNTDWPQPDSPSFVNSLCTSPGVIKDATGKITSTCVPGLLKQVDVYLNNVQFKPSSQTAFFIWAGANDLINAYLARMAKYSGSFAWQVWFAIDFPLPAREDLYPVEQKTVDNIMAAKKKLIDAGVKAEMIYILDLPDLSKTPFILHADNAAMDSPFPPDRKDRFKSSISNMSQDFNQKLHSQQVEAKYAIPASHYIPIAKLFNDMIANPKEYGLSNTEDSCVAANKAPACKGYLFYNLKHPTAAVHEMIAINIVDTLFNT